MPGYPPLPAAFSWRDDGHRLVLSLEEVPLAQVEAAGSAWIVRTLVHQLVPSGDPPSRIAVPSMDQGRAWITAWASCRQASLASAIAQHPTMSGIVPQSPNNA